LLLYSEYNFFRIIPDKLKMLDKKIKSCGLTVKDLDGKKGIVQFYSASFDNEKDSDGDIILKGAFQKTISEQKGRIKHLLNHDVWKVPGVILEITEDHKGLLVTSQLAKSKDGEFSTLAKDTLINYEAGVITEHSIGYRAVKEEYDEQKSTNFIKEIKLWETSSLTGWGANKNTPMVGMKSFADLAEQLKTIDKVLRCTDISDEGAQTLIKYSKRIHIYLKKHKANQQPPSGTLVKSDASIDYHFLTQNFKL